MDAETTSLSENIPELPPAPPRESLIVTAIKFLQNSKVSQSPLEQKKQFLTKKGLTDEEILIAITRSGLNTAPSVPVPLGSGPVALAPPPRPVSTWTRIREYSSLAVVIAGVVYGIYCLYKRFIEPFLMQTQKIQDEKLQKMEEGIRSVNTELGQNMQEIQSKMDTIQEKIDVQSSKISQVAANVTSHRAQTSGVSDSAIGELKAEITSIKGLLLSRNQFPLSSIPRPVIPSWQMKPSPEIECTSEQAKTLMNGENAESSEDTAADDEGQLNGNPDDATEPLQEGTQNLKGVIPNGTEVKNMNDTSPEQETNENLLQRTET